MKFLEELQWELMGYWISGDYLKKSLNLGG
jgi:hypothetical protein